MEQQIDFVNKIAQIKTELIFELDKLDKDDRTNIESIVQTSDYNNEISFIRNSSSKLDENIESAFLFIEETKFSVFHSTQTLDNRNPNNLITEELNCNLPSELNGKILDYLNYLLAV